MWDGIQDVECEADVLGFTTFMRLLVIFVLQAETSNCIHILCVPPT